MTKHFCKDFGQCRLVRGDESIDIVKERAKAIIDRLGNSFAARDIVVFSVGDDISISRGRRGDELRDFRRFFVAARRRNAQEIDCQSLVAGGGDS